MLDGDLVWRRTSRLSLRKIANWLASIAISWGRMPKSVFPGRWQRKPLIIFLNMRLISHKNPLHGILLVVSHFWKLI